MSTALSDGRHLLLARWVLELLAPEEVPDLATTALLDGCTAQSVAVLAGLSRPTRGDVEDELPRLLSDLRTCRPTEREALKALVDDTAHRIAEGSLPPIEGANDLWWLWGYARDPDDDPALWAQFLPFISLASQVEDEGSEHSGEDEADIVRAATALLENGGLRIKP